MTELIDISKILNTAPYGTNLWSSLLGACQLYCVTDYGDIYVTYHKGNTGYVEKFDSYGRKNSNGECLLFPSKDNRDWSTFKVIKHFNTGDKILIPYLSIKESCLGTNNIYRYRLDFYSHYDNIAQKHITTSGLKFDDSRIHVFDDSLLGKKIESLN